MSYDKSKFLDRMGKKVVVGLFEEFDRKDRKFKAPFKLADWKNAYIDSRDPTEYSAAMKLVGDWEHWLLIRNHPFIKPYVDSWHKEMEVKLRSEAVEAMRTHAKSQGGIAAAKWLAEKGYDKKQVGRPSTKENHLDNESETHVSSDMERLGLRVVGK